MPTVHVIGDVGASGTGKAEGVGTAGALPPLLTRPSDRGVLLLFFNMNTEVVNNARSHATRRGISTQEQKPLCIRWERPS